MPGGRKDEMPKLKLKRHREGEGSKQLFELKNSCNVRDAGMKARYIGPLDTQLESFLTPGVCCKAEARTKLGRSRVGGPQRVQS